MTRTRPGPRRSLSEEQLLDAALRLLDAKGVEGLSVRGLAAEVGVAPNAVYTYFPDKAAVLAGVVERVLGRVAVGAFADSGPSWRERVVALAEAVRAELLAHPGAVPLLFSVPLTGPNALAVGETLLAVLAGA
ncbi:MAG TPA: TetR/AcrR family transcriptional regulator, partial [Pseudonocardia sp.]|nr:TetR/AcrR family transcriptional regulator [Pseudonocardia sp.]